MKFSYRKFSYLNQVFLEIWGLKHISTFEPKYFSCSETAQVHGIPVGAGWGEEKCFSFIYFPNPKFRLLHLGLKPQKAFSCLFELSQMVPTVHKSAPAAHESPLMLSSSLSPSQGAAPAGGRDQAQLHFQCHPGNDFPSGCHIRDLLSPLQFNTSLTTSGEVSQPQPQTLENVFLHTSLLELWSI